MLIAADRKNARRIDNRRPAGISGDYPFKIVYAFVIVLVYIYWH